MSRPSPSHKRHRPTADELSRAQKVRQLHTPPLTPERTQVVRLSMPRQLPAVNVAPVPSAALAAIDPELAHVPVAFVRQRVQAMAKSICDVLVTCAPKNALTNPLPRTIEIIARDPSVDPSLLPTHYLIVYNPRTPDQRGLLFPAHSLVLATQCAAVPRFGPTTRELREDNTFEVPLLGLPVPAPKAFNTLYLYLHTQNINSLLASLIPLPAAALATISIEHEGMPSRLATTLSDWLSMRALLSTLKMCHGVWANATALQVNDDRLWRFIHYAWAILIAAVERSSGQPAPPIDQIADDEEADAVDRALGDVAPAPADAPPPYEA